jgi:hypothetical protein
MDINGGTWGRHKPKSELDWVIHHASQLPGPADYAGPRMFTKQRGGVISKNITKSELDMQLARAARSPGPGEYQIRTAYTSCSCLIGDTDTPSELDTITMRAQETPGPSDYCGNIIPQQKPKLKSLQKMFKKPAANKPDILLL